MTLSLLLSSDFEVFAPFDRQLFPVLAFGTLHPENNLLRGLRFFSEDGFSLTTITFLLAIVTSLSLSENGLLSLLVLRHFMQRVLLALAFAEGLSSFGNVDHV